MSYPMEEKISYFYGYLEGNEDIVIRYGSKSSGIHAHIRSCNNDVYASLCDNDGKNELHLTIPKELTVYINGKKKRL